jgi:putative NIF3 family GTP cyclohydrolase 1 type 2
MNIRQIYNLAIVMGVHADPRGRRGVERALGNVKKRYQKLAKDERELFDRESLINPYADTRILYGEGAAQVKTVLAGIDINSGDIALAKILNLKPDLIINHHPQGKALAALDDVMNLQADLMAASGVPINVAEGVMKNRIDQVSRLISPANHYETVDAAKLAKIPFMCTHTVCDNQVYNFLTKWLERKNFETVGELVEALKKIPEYKIAAQNNAGPRIFAGSPENRPGKIVALEITGGTEGSKEVYEKLAQAGVGTIIGMHMKDENRDEALKYHINVVIAGHISSDSIGMNLFLDKLAQKGIKIIPTSGLIRVKRTK